MINPSATSCTVHQVGMSGIPGCFNILTRATIFWGKFFVIFELSLCLLSVSDDENLYSQTISLISFSASWRFPRYLCLSTRDDLRWLYTNAVSCLILNIFQKAFLFLSFVSNSFVRTSREKNK